VVRPVLPKVGAVISSLRRVIALSSASVDHAPASGNEGKEGPRPREPEKPHYILTPDVGRPLTNLAVSVNTEWSVGKELERPALAVGREDVFEAVPASEASRGTTQANRSAKKPRHHFVR
jgi:hypothetical protein